MMANPDHVGTLRRGVDAWNAWRKQRAVEPDLRGADLHMADLRRADLSGAWLDRADLRGAYLTGADLSDAHLFGAFLNGADLRNVGLRRADLSRASLGQANLSGANLSGAHLEYASLVDADITNADLTGCHIYGVSAWGVKLNNETKQENLIITKSKRFVPSAETQIVLDDIEVAQLIYLILDNKKIRGVIDTMTSKLVLTLGRFDDLYTFSLRCMKTSGNEACFQ